eukprot:Lithocolla_globosa_v1_NODE_133_length_5886_cov_43.511748.p2 type:complete len:290 gc:universal NODE_133_length_5886_cov_43.511748:3981-3112(-)
MPEPKKLLADPHSISSQLDKDTTEALITRLESRGKDSIFRSTFESYFPLLSSCENVLEVGCGTGVVVRALAASPGFKGQVTGVDQCVPFLEKAKSLSLSLNNLRFVCANATTLLEDLRQGGVENIHFDAIILHTLISHVTEPERVLTSCRDIASMSCKLIVTDGDYSCLSYHHPSDPKLATKMSAGLVQATFAQPTIMRDIFSLLPSAGWKSVSVSGQCVVEAGQTASYWLSFARAYLPRVKASGLATEEEAEQWWKAQQQAVQDGTFFACCNYLTLVAQPFEKESPPR